MGKSLRVFQKSFLLIHSFFVKMQKYAFLGKNGLSEILSAVGNKPGFPTSKKHQTLEILTKVDFLRNF